jgi:hypothetical protein
MRADNVEFRLGEIEHLPIADGTIDVILSSSLLKNGSVAEGSGSGSRSRSEDGVESPDST